MLERHNSISITCKANVENSNLKLSISVHRYSKFSLEHRSLDIGTKLSLYGVQKETYKYIGLSDSFAIGYPRPNQ